MTGSGEEWPERLCWRGKRVNLQGQRADKLGRGLVGIGRCSSSIKVKRYCYTTLVSSSSLSLPGEK